MAKGRRETGAKSGRGKTRAGGADAKRPAAAKPVRKEAPGQGKGPGKAGKGTAAGTQFPKLAGDARREEPLSRHTTFRIGGPARWLFVPANPDAAAEAVAWARSNGIPWMVLGLGSNVLVRDGGFPGLVLKIGKGLDELKVKGGTWTVGAGLPTPLLARRTAEAGLAGVQRLVGVPGTVGGGVFMNAGAHGQDFGGVLASALVLTPQGELKSIARAAIPFRYRSSGLDGNVVLGATLRFAEDDPARLKADMQMLLKKRREGTPFDQPCCGSVFRNPEVMTAGRLIDRCGLKGRRVGGAEISTMHGNYIVNRGGASAEDVIRLIDVARTAVFKEFGIELELEVKILGASK